MYNSHRVSDLALKILSGSSSSSYRFADEEYRFLFEGWEGFYDDILYWANKIRQHFKGNRVKLCSIVNAKSGMCSENCRFCAQSSSSRASGISVYPLLSKSELVKTYESCAGRGLSSCFGIVTSGESPSEEEIKNIGEAISEIKKKNAGVRVSASLGRLDFESLKYLKEKGLDVYHHNLETSESFFENICTTHSYKSKVETLLNAKRASLALCSGGIFGLGESPAQRFEMACALRKIGPDSIPLNFLNPIKGTEIFETAPRLSPREILSVVAAFRFIFPDKDIRVCGGREVNLRDLQSWIFYAGANGMMTGGYLTTPGRSPDEDERMIRDLGLEAE